jgi:hypothetical protein
MYDQCIECLIVTLFSSDHLRKIKKVKQARAMNRKSICNHVQGERKQYESYSTFLTTKINLKYYYYSFTNNSITVVYFALNQQLNVSTSIELRLSLDVIQLFPYFKTNVYNNDQ